MSRHYTTIYDLAAAILFDRPGVQPGRISPRTITAALEAAGMSIGPLTIAAIRANMAAIRPRGRRRRDPEAARIMCAYRLHPATASAIRREAARTGESQGQVIDRLAAQIQGEEKDKT